MAKTSLTGLITLLLLMMSLSIVSAGSDVKTSKDDCTNPVNANHYLANEVVYIHAIGFSNGNYSWRIVGLPEKNDDGGASCDAGSIIANGSISVNSSSFCFPAYTINSDDCGEYKVYLDNKKDNYHVDKPVQIPEFGILVGGLTILGALLAFMFIRRK